MTGRNNYWHKIVNKYGKPDVQILARWDTEQEAFDHEVLLISCFRELGHKLANLTDGGEGFVGLKFTETHKKKLSIKYEIKRDEISQKVIEMYDDNKTTREISEQLKISRGVITKIFKKENIICANRQVIELFNIIYKY